MRGRTVRKQRPPTGRPLRIGISLRLEMKICDGSAEARWDNARRGEPRDVLNLKDCGRVAQLVEQCPFKAWVAGSSPAALTKFIAVSFVLWPPSEMLSMIL